MVSDLKRGAGNHMKTVNVATFFPASSYGAVLQATALNRYLRQLGFDAFLIDYQFQDMAIDQKRSVKHLLFYAARRKRERLTKRFLAENVQMTRPFLSYGDLASSELCKQLCLAGSDQIWNPKECRDFFFLRFAEQGKRISYAASAGSTEIPPDKREKFEQYVRAFDHLSVREGKLRELLSTFCEKPIQEHVDPTLLLSQSAWTTMARPCRIRKPYYLVFPLWWNKAFNAQLKLLHSQTGFDIVALSESPNVYCTKRIASAGPGEFLWLFDHAQGVVTSSYHGTIFSMIFEKPFCAVINPKLPLRIESLLEKFHCEQARFGSELRFYQPVEGQIEALLTTERERSKQFFMRVLGDIT